MYMLGYALHCTCVLADADAVQDSNLALHSEGIKMTVASEQPHFLAVDDDVLGTGVVIYRLHVSSLCTCIIHVFKPW